MSRIHERRRIFALLDGRLSPAGRSTLESHLERCGTCRDYLERTRAARDALSTMGGQEPEIQWSTVDAAVERATTAPREVPGTVRWPRWALGTAVAAATAALVLVVAHRQMVPPPGSEPSRPNGEVQVTMTLLDSLPLAGRLTTVGQGARWRRPGLGWQPADLSTVITEETEVGTDATSVASIQVASLSGVHVEPLTTATFRQITRDTLRLDLDEGTVSLVVHSKSGLRDVRVITPQAEVQVTGTTLSVETRADRTRVVVAKGRATIRPAAGGDPRTVEAPGTLVVSSSGHAGSVDDEQARAEVQRLRNLHFNFFEGDPPGEAIAFAPQGPAGRVTISFGKMLAGLAPLDLLAPRGVDAATLAFEDGSTLEMPLKLEPSATTVISFSAPIVQTEPVQAKARVTSKTQREAPVAAVPDEPEPAHEGYLDPLLVKILMKKKNDELRACYEKFLAKKPEAGVVKARIRFTVGSSGKVISATAGTNVDDEGLDSCLVAATKKILFPPPDGGSIEFEYPVTFAPK